MIRILMVIILIYCAACNNQEFVKHRSGVQYKIISDRQSDLVRPGETLKMHLKQVYKDSVLNDTRDSIPYYQPYDSTQLSAESYEIFSKVRMGDSIIFKVLTDSAFKNKWPPFAKKGEYLYTYVKVQHIFGVKEDFREDFKKELGKRR